MWLKTFTFSFLHWSELPWQQRRASLITTPPGPETAEEELPWWQADTRLVAVLPLPGSQSQVTFAPVAGLYQHHAAGFRNLCT
jgi:hypothetical protein